MDSLYQNSVSEFDLNLFEQPTDATPGTSTEPCPEARKLSVARLKNRLKGVSQVVHKAKKTNEILLDVQKELLATKQELEETQNLLFAKNEEYKVVCDERSVYFEQTTEYCNEIRSLKERLAKYEQLDYDMEMKDRIINGYSEQMKGLQVELEKMEQLKNQSNKELSASLKNAKVSKTLIEKQIVRLLKDYILPNTKSHNRWLTSVIKQHCPEALKNFEKNVKKESVSENLEDSDLDEDEPLGPLAQKRIQRNASNDMDCVESVDTGRGSSIGSSDGEKSFHSPEYNINDSHDNNACKKCSIPKCDASTSPMSQYDSAIDDSAANMPCRKCNQLSRIDSCTSPIPSLMNDETSFEVKSRDRVDHNSSQKEQSGSVRVMSCTQENDDVSPCHKIKEVTKKETLVKLQDFTFDSDDNDDMEYDCRPASPMEEINTRLSDLPADFDKVMKESNKDIPSLMAHGMDSTVKLSSEEMPTHNANDCHNSIDKSQEIDEPHNGSQNNSPVLVKIQITAASDSEDGEEMDNVNRAPDPAQKASIFSSIFDDASNCSTTSVCKPLTRTQTDLHHETIDSKLSLNKSKQQEKECLELNNSNNSKGNTEDDIEIQSILDKMRLQLQFISPIPKTPPQSHVRSPNLPSDEPDNILGSQVQVISDTINAKLELLRLKVQEVFNPFVESLPQCLEQIPRLFSQGQLNEELLRNLLFDRDNKKTENVCPSPHKETWNYHRQPDIVDLNCGSMLTITNENNVHDSEECLAMEDDMIVGNVEQPINEKTYVSHIEDAPEINKENPQTERTDKKINASLMKLEASHSRPCENGEVSKECFNRNEPFTHVLFDSEDEYGDTNTNKDTGIHTIESWKTNTNEDNGIHTIESRKSILYEGASDSDDGILQIDESPQNLNRNSGQVTDAKKVKSKKLTQLDKFRKKMEPSFKIKADLKQTARKLRARPTPLPCVTPKKKVTASDSAATLNDKTVYENAVKTLAALKSEKIPKIVIEDCVRLTQCSPKKTDDKNNNTTNHTAINTPVKKRTLSGTEIHSQEIQNSSSNKKSSNINTAKKKRRSIHEDNDDMTLAEILHNTTNMSDLNTDVCNNTPKKGQQKSPKFAKEKCDKSPKGIRQNLFNKPDSDTSKIKRIHSVEQTLDLTAKEAKRKRTSSIADGHSPKARSNSTMEPESPRVLRSSSFSRNKDSESGTLVAAPRRELRSNVELKDTPMLLPTGRRQRISRVQTNSQQNIANMMSKEKKDTKQVSDNAQVSQTSPLDTKTACANQKSKSPEISNDRLVSYADLDLLTNDNNDTPRKAQQESMPAEDNPYNGGNKNSLLCQTIEKYGVRKLKYAAKAISENKVKDICNKLETSLAEIVELPHELYQSHMKKLVQDIKTVDVKLFLLGFIKFLRHPERKIELYNKTVAHPCPPMTKKEQVLLYVIDELQKSIQYKDVVSQILMNIEYALFALNKTAEEFDVIEAMAHFYALLCRYYQKISKLRLFITDAMYCLQLKSVILVQQCLEVWMLVLPLGHMGLAKCPLVTCLVYLLHFYKCEDKFNRVRDIRNTLRRKYNYDFTDWSEPKLLEHFRIAVTEIRDKPMDRKLLRLSLLILAKRNGAVWCHNNIVKNMLQPLIDDPKTPDSARRFAVSMLGPLLRPYPANMKVHSETIIDYLLDLLGKKNSWKMQEAIVYSLMCIDKNYKNNRLHRFLAGWMPKQVSPDFEQAVIDYVRSTKLQTWKTILSWQI